MGDLGRCKLSENEFPSCRTLHRDIYRTIVLLHETSQRMVVKDFVEKKKTVTMGLGNTAKAVDHVKIESI